MAGRHFTYRAVQKSGSTAMSSIAKPPQRSKKIRCLGADAVVTAEHYANLEVGSKLECIRALIPLGLLHLHNLLEEEICALAGRPHGSNPGNVRLADQRHPLRLPRVPHRDSGELPLQTLNRVRGTGQLDDLLLKRVL